MFHRFSLALIAFVMLFAVLVQAADPPACAQPCIGQYTAAGCGANDNACMCQNGTFCNQMNNCFRTSCTTADWRTAYNWAVGLCNAAGVTQTNVINPPPPKRTFVPVYAGLRAARE